jgi:signal transduction histidine kinase
MTDPTTSANPLPSYTEARVTAAVIIAVSAVSTATGLLNATSINPAEVLDGWILLVVGNAASLFSFFLLRTGFQQAAGLVIAVVPAGISTALMILGFGLHDVALLGFPLAVLISGLMLRGAALTVPFAASVMGILVVAVLEAKGKVASPIGGTALIDLLSILIILTAVAILVRMLVNGFHLALGRALASEDALALSNRELEARALRLEAQDEERAALISDLEAKNAELERFSYTVSHDLKSPLITVRAYLDSIDKDLAEGHHARVRADLQRVAAASERMRDLLDGLLKLSRVGRIVNTLEKRSLRELAQEAIDLASGRLAARGIVVVVAPELPVVRVDRQRIVDVLVNLLDNASKFMGDQGAPRVEISATESAGRVVVRVKDNGIGIEAKNHLRVFVLFERVSSAFEGTGLGLALARRVIEAHGGRLWVESEGLGHGSTFCFSLPQI